MVRNVQGKNKRVAGPGGEPAAGMTNSELLLGAVLRRLREAEVSIEAARQLIAHHDRNLQQREAMGQRDGR